MTPLTYSDWKAVGWRGALRFLHASFSLACSRAPLGRVEKLCSPPSVFVVLRLSPVFAGCGVHTAQLPTFDAGCDCAHNAPMGMFWG